MATTLIEKAEAEALCDAILATFNQKRAARLNEKLQARHRDFTWWHPSLFKRLVYFATADVSRIWTRNVLPMIELNLKTLNSIEDIPQSYREFCKALGCYEKYLENMVDMGYLPNYPRMNTDARKARAIKKLCENSDSAYITITDEEAEILFDETYKSDK